MMIHPGYRTWTLLLLAGLLLGNPAIASDSDEEPLIISTYPSISGERIYIVEEGDTLWDISDEFFSDPHFWPTLWAFNPQITNPHWIYPGDYVILFPRNLLDKAGPIVWSKSRYTEQPKNIILESRSKGFISERDFKESGKIAYSREERAMLSQYDEIYIEFYIPKKIRRGEEFTVYRKGEPVVHPISGKVIGHNVRHLGVARVLGAEKHYVKALLLTSFEEIERGDMLTDIFKHRFRVTPTKNKVDLAATLISAFDGVKFIGENEYVFVDKGRQDGVEAGNRLVALERGDGRKELDKDTMEDMPWEIIGEIMIIEPYDTTSLGVVTRSIKELNVGQRCELRTSYDALTPELKAEDQ